VGAPLKRNVIRWTLFMADENIVESAIDCVGPNSERHRIVVELGRPYRASTGEWSCPVNIRGLYDRLSDVRGEDALQALCLAASLACSLLQSYVEAGGRLVHPETNDDYSLKNTFSGVGDAESDSGRA
jgi:hypothetical protein